MMPNYDEIAKRLHDGGNATMIATALREAYRRGASDGLDADDVASLVHSRVGRHVSTLEAIGRRIESLTDEIRTGIPVSPTPEPKP